MYLGKSQRRAWKGTRQAVMGASSGKGQVGTFTGSACAHSLALGWQDCFSGPCGTEGTAPGPCGPQHLNSRGQFHAQRQARGARCRDAQQRIFTAVPAVCCIPQLISHMKCIRPHKHVPRAADGPTVRTASPPSSLGSGPARRRGISGQERENGGRVQRRCAAADAPLPLHWALSARPHLVHRGPAGQAGMTAALTLTCQARSAASRPGPNSPIPNARRLCLSSPVRRKITDTSRD